MALNNQASPALRHRKKARQRAELLRVAAELFRREGYERTRMEDIAAQADVSVPTVYNYFASKRDVLIELLMEDRRETQASFERVVSDPPDEPADAFASLIHANVENIRSAEDKRLWRDLIAAVAKSHDHERDQFDRNHEIFKGYIKRLLRHYIILGKLSKTLPLPLAADIVFAVNSSNLRYLVAARTCTPEQIRKLSRQQMMLLMSDWRAPQQREASTVSSKARKPRRGSLKDRQEPRMPHPAGS